jgi:hypothetical protein
MKNKSRKYKSKDKHVDDGSIRVRKPYKKLKKTFWEDFEQEDEEWEKLWDK